MGKAEQDSRIGKAGQTEHRDRQNEKCRKEKAEKTSRTEQV
jgi:hypothetical protein